MRLCKGLVDFLSLKEYGDGEHFLHSRKTFTMAIETDDPDINPAWLFTHTGGNGDYYVTIVAIHDSYDEHGNMRHIAIRNTMRLRTSGSNININFREPLSELHWKLEEAKLNEYPDEEIERAIKRKDGT